MKILFYCILFSVIFIGSATVKNNTLSLHTDRAADGGIPKASILSSLS